MSFELQPTLRGELVALHPLRPEDHDALFAVACDALIWELHPAKERAEPGGFRAFFDEALATGGAFLVRDAVTGEVIGSSRYFGLDESQGLIEIGWTFLARRCWGGRYNRELKQLMLTHAFRYVDTVIFIVHPDNLRSRRAMLKIGGVPDPELNARGLMVYRIRRSDPALEIRVDDLAGPEVAALLSEHLASMHARSPPGAVHALDLEGLRAADVSFYSAWRQGELVGCGALKALDPQHGELKSMRTARAHLRTGVAVALLEHLLAEARARGYRRVSLETGSGPDFAPAQALYTRFGFKRCAPFGNYREDGFSHCMTLALEPTP